MNSLKYIDIAQDVLIPFIQENMPEDVIFQQDSASVHVSRHSLQWFNDKNLDLLYHTAQNPDLNLMENL
jgi:Fe-S cluster assembly iron-binding protein IscA